MGSQPVVRQVKDGIRVVGRDFAFAASATSSSITGWELIGGMPLTPCVLSSSGLRAFVQSYANFKINGCVFHYITSSPTSQAGDVAFYFARDRLSPLPDTSNNSFLPFLLSDPHTVIGPQWTNHSALVAPADDWKSTCYGMNSDINEEGAGDVLFYSKTSTANSPGYVIMDYDITFKELSVNPRAGLLPVARGQYSPFTIGGALVSGNNVLLPVAGKDITNNGAVSPNGLTAGDVYKFVFSTNASTVNNTWITDTPSNALQTSDARTIALDDGYTYYLYYDGTNFTMFPTKIEAETRTNNIMCRTTGTLYLSGFVSLVAVTGSTTTQVSY